MQRRRSYIIRLCSMISLQGMTGYFIREKDIHTGDVTFLQENGYQVYSIRSQENKPYTIEKQIMCRGRVGIAAFPAPILFPPRKDIPRNSVMNYYTLNNQYSDFGYEMMEHRFKTIVKSGN